MNYHLKYSSIQNLLNKSASKTFFRKITFFWHLQFQNPTVLAIPIPGSILYLHNKIDRILWKNFRTERAIPLRGPACRAEVAEKISKTLILAFEVIGTTPLVRTHLLGFYTIFSLIILCTFIEYLLKIKSKGLEIRVERNQLCIFT